MLRPARALTIVALAAACARAPGSPAPEPPPATPVPDPCVVAGDPARYADTVSVVLDPAPAAGGLPETGSDWFLAVHTVEPLVRLDCSGAVRPALASSWTQGDGGRVWIFTLREGAALPDGSPLTPEALITDWRRPAATARLALGEVTGTEPAGQREIRVRFAEPADSAPVRLADPILAPGLERPADAARTTSRLRLVPAPRDLRDAVDAGLDFIVTADAATLAYARERPELAIVPLPWSRTYLLVSPQPFSLARNERFRRSLAQDVVRQSARPAEPIVWWDPACAAAATPTGSSARESPVVAYPADDPAAAALAARLVAVGAAGPRGTVQPLPLPKLLGQLEQGQPTAAVLPVSRLDPAPCAARSLALAGWSVTPLVDTRWHLIARNKGPAVRADGFGVLSVLGPPRDTR
jgi:hypothetical protein